MYGRHRLDGGVFSTSVFFNALYPEGKSRNSGNPLHFCIITSLYIVYPLQISLEAQICVQFAFIVCVAVKKS